MDRTPQFPLTITVATPLLAICYLVLIFTPGTRSVVAPYIILSLLGASSFILVPVALEFLADITHPVSPEVTSVLGWAGGQLLGGVFIIIMSALRDPDGLDEKNYPPGNMTRALIFQGILACLFCILPFGIGVKQFGTDGDVN